MKRRRVMRLNPLVPTSWALALPRHDREGAHRLPGSAAKIRRLTASLKRIGWDEKRPAKVTVRRDGTIFLDEGNHRLAAAHRAGIKRVPVEFYTPDGRRVEWSTM